MFGHYTLTSQSSHSIDLHRKSVKQAKEMVSNAFEEAKAKKLTDLTVVTGIGNHVNKNGSRGVLFDGLPEWLKQPEFSEVIRNISKDMGAYEIQFNFNDEFNSRVKELNSNFSLLPQSAIVEYHIKAKAGDERSQRELGIFYVLGICVDQNIEKGIAILKQSAETSVDNQIQLGRIYSSNNFPTIKDYRKSRHWYSKAEKKNHPDALYALGKMYELGRGVIKNIEKAADYFARAALYGHPEAVISLGEIYFTTTDIAQKKHVLATIRLHFQKIKTPMTPTMTKSAKLYLFRLCILQDHNKAFTWIEAEGENDAVAEYYLGKLILLRGEAGDINRAGFCFKRAADMGDVDARFEVVLGHLVGKGLKKNVKLAVEKLTILAEEKHPNSLFLLCEVFTPAGPLQNIPQAIKLLITAAEEDQTDAQFQLIKYFQENQHSNLITKKIFEKIAKRLEEIALSGNQRAQCHVGMLYSNGSTRFPKNIEKAIDFFEKSANQGNETAIERLVPLLHTAPFSKQVVKKLLFWFTQAAEKGEPSAQVNLGIFILTPTIMNPVVHSALGYYWIYKSALQKNSTAINFLKEKCIAGNKETILKMVVDQFKFRDGVEILPAISALKNISKPINIPAFFSPPALSTTGVVAKNPNPPVTVISLPLPSMASTSMFSASAAVFTNSKPVATSKKNQRQKRCWKKK